MTAISTRDSRYQFASFGFDNNVGFGFLMPYDDDYSNSSTTLDWNNIINQGFAIGSQIVGAFGKNPTTQVAYNPAQNSIFAVGQTGQQTYNPYGNLTQQQIAALQQGGVGSTVGGGVDGIVNWFMRNPAILLGGGLALYLLFRQPPGRR